MAYTPFPPAEHENPSVLHSHDGKSWTTPTGLVNPIEDRSGAAYNGYNSDTDIIYDPIGKRIGVIWRAMGLDLTDGGYLDGPRLHMKWSSDGTTWTERLNVIDSLNGVSPALVREADGTWVMFLGNDAHIYRAAEPTGP